MTTVYGIIYKITNTQNGKVYIGQTTKTLKTRFAGHLYAAFKANRNNPLCFALRKYGETAFIYEQIDSACDAKSLDELEEKYILEYNSVDISFGYNILPSATANPMHTKICQDKMKDLWKNSDYRERQSKSRKGIIRDDEWKENHSKAAKEFWQKDGHRKKISDKAKDHWKRNPDVDRLKKATTISAEKSKTQSLAKIERMFEIAKKHTTITGVAKELGLSINSASNMLKTYGKRDELKNILLHNKEVLDGKFV